MMSSESDDDDDDNDDELVRERWDEAKHLPKRKSLEMIKLHQLW